MDVNDVLESKKGIIIDFQVDLLFLKFMDLGKLGCFLLALF